MSKLHLCEKVLPGHHTYGLFFSFLFLHRTCRSFLSNLIPITKLLLVNACCIAFEKKNCFATGVVVLLRLCTQILMQVIHSPCAYAFAQILLQNNFPDSHFAMPRIQAVR